ncbi:MAG: GC-type dockerin domain-anchored protein [Phycisphaerales bacterium JB052]
MNTNLIWGSVCTATTVLGLAATHAQCDQIPYQGLLGQVDTAGSVNDVAVSNAVAYIVDSSEGLVAVDVQSPAAPMVLGQLEVDGAEHVVVANDIAYVTSPSTGYILLIDVSDPMNLAQVGSIDVGTEFSSVAVNGSMLALSAAFTQLRVYDVRDPAAVELVEQIELGATVDIEFVGSRMYVLGSGLAIYDVSDPASAVEIGATQQAGGERLVVVGDHAYALTGSAGITTFDVSDPAQPAYVDFSSGVVPGGLFDLVGDSGTMFVMDAPILYQLDVSDPSAPARACWQYLGGTPVNMDFDNQILFVASGENGLQIVDAAGFCGRCEADMTEDGMLNYFDVASFINFYSASHPIADLNGDTQFNMFDISAFISAYLDGCP